MRGLRGMGDLVELAFESAVGRDVPFSALQRLAGQSLDNNPRLGITGRLRLVDGRLHLVMEGTAGAVMPMAARILADRRHRAVRVQRLGPVAARRFAEWTVEGFGLGPAVAVAPDSNLRPFAPRPVRSGRLAPAAGAVSG